MTPAQLATIKADILANPDLNAFPAGLDGSYGIAALYNLPAVPAFTVWRTDTPVSAINDAIDDTKFTPTDLPTVTQLPAEAMLWLNRSQMVLIKQANLQRLLQGRDTVDASKANVRASLRDALIALPTGANGANTSASGASAVNALTACTRAATRIEKLLVTSSPQTGTVAAGVMGYEGQVSYQHIEAARIA